MPNYAALQLLPHRAQDPEVLARQHEVFREGLRPVVVGVQGISEVLVHHEVVHPLEPAIFLENVNLVIFEGFDRAEVRSFLDQPIHLLLALGFPLEFVNCCGSLLGHLRTFLQLAL